MTAPQFVMIGGPNGAGKSTCAPALLPDGVPYVNADDIAKGLGSENGSRDVEAARLLFREWDRLEAERADFAIETTLASRSLAPRVRRLQQQGYRFHLLYLWLPTPELAIERVATRVRAGGHDIPAATIRRRHGLGARNFMELYQPIADTWRVYQNIEPGHPELIAYSVDKPTTLVRADVWEQIQQARGSDDVRVAHRDMLERCFRDNALVTSAIARATREAAQAHKRAGRAIASIRNGEIVIVQPDEIGVAS